MTEAHQLFFDSVKQHYPEVAIDRERMQFLLSPHTVTLPNQALAQAQKAISALFSLRNNKFYLDAVKSKLAKPEIISDRVNNFGVLMAYDFHWDAKSEKLKLIEVNTNASGYLIVEELYESQNRETLFLDEPPLTSLRQSFEAEFNVNTGDLAIIDEQPDTQNMYIEFLMYQQQCKAWGFERCEIFDYQDLQLNPAGELESDGAIFKNIYNRYCDFDLSDPSSSALRQAYLSGLATLSPHPKEYLLSADKNRLIEYSQPDFLVPYLTAEQVSDIENVLLTSRTIEDFSSKDELWSKRKKYFFKPKQSYGSKAVYRGKSISKKAFEDIYSQDPIIQEYAPPDVYISEDEQEWKYDLRFYCYKDQVQQVCARLYQGQLTNFKNLGGGFATVEFK